MWPSQWPIALYVTRSAHASLVLRPIAYAQSLLKFKRPAWIEIEILVSTLTISILYVYEEWTHWWDCALTQAGLSIRCSKWCYFFFLRRFQRVPDSTHTQKTPFNGDINYTLDDLNSHEASQLVADKNMRKTQNNQRSRPAELVCDACTVGRHVIRTTSNM